MSSSRQFIDGLKQRKATGKSNFVQTCNLLSQYIKEKGNLRDLNLEIGGKVESLEALVKSGSSISASLSATINILKDKGKSAELPTEQQPSKALHFSINAAEDASSEPTSKEAATTDSKTAPLTIFYSGRVLLFDDYPADKAEELMAFAKKESSQTSCGILSNTFRENQIYPDASTTRPPSLLPQRPQATIPLKGVGISSNTFLETTGAAASGPAASSSRTEARVSPHPEANSSDMPIARRSSLHRFLEKRKDRAAARGPYQVVQEQPPSSSKGDELLDLKL